jgi:hypothetical protein
MRIEVSDEPLVRRRTSKPRPPAPEPVFGLPSGDVSGVTPLNARAAQRCPVKVQHRFAPPAIPPRIVPALAPFIEAGLAHEQAVNAKHAELVDVVEIEGGGVAATLAALEAGVDLLKEAWLPIDQVGRRSGRPDWLVRAQRQSASGKHGYWPVDIKQHKATQPAGSTTASRYPALVAPLARPAAEKAKPRAGWFERADTTRKNDLMQLAHYWRMLEACGHAPQTDGPVWGGIIGTENCIVWTDLTLRRFRASEWLPVERTPRRLLSALELYDIEFAFRLDIARAARAHSLGAGLPLLVEPVKIGECKSCEWWPACNDTLTANGVDISLDTGRPPIDGARAARCRSSVARRPGRA